MTSSASTSLAAPRCLEKDLRAGEGGVLRLPSALPSAVRSLRDLHFLGLRVARRIDPLFGGDIEFSRRTTFGHFWRRTKRLEGRASPSFGDAFSGARFSALASSISGRPSSACCAGAATGASSAGLAVLGGAVSVASVRIPSAPGAAVGLDGVGLDGVGLDGACGG